MKLRLLFVGLFFPFIVFAQMSKVELGITAAPQLSNLYPSTLNSYEKPLLTYSAGISGQYLLSKSWLVMAELNYQQTGRKVKFGEQFCCNGNDPALNYIEETVSRSNYFQIPVLLRYRTDVDKKVSFFFNTGVDWSVLLSSSFKVTGSSGASIKTTDSSKHPSYLGWIYGLGMQLNISSKLYIPLELRYTHVIVTPGGIDYLNNVKYGTLGLVTGLTYRFGQ